MGDGVGQGEKVILCCDLRMMHSYTPEERYKYKRPMLFQY